MVCARLSILATYYHFRNTVVAILRDDDSSTQLQLLPGVGVAQPNPQNRSALCRTGLPPHLLTYAQRQHLPQGLLKAFDSPKVAKFATIIPPQTCRARDQFLQIMAEAGLTPTAGGANDPGVDIPDVMVTVDGFTIMVGEGVYKKLERILTRADIFKGT